MSRRVSRRVFRSGRVHVLKEMCPTCIFRPGNLMHLRDGRVEQLVDRAVATDRWIPCHSTLYGNGGAAVCHGFFRRHATAPLQIADRLGFIEWVTLDKKTD